MPDTQHRVHGRRVSAVASAKEVSGRKRRAAALLPEGAPALACQLTGPKRFQRAERRPPAIGIYTSRETPCFQGFSPSPPDAGRRRGLGRGGLFCWRFPSPWPSPHSFLVERGKLCRYQCSQSLRHRQGSVCLRTIAARCPAFSGSAQGESQETPIVAAHSIARCRVRVARGRGMAANRSWVEAA